MDNLGLLSSLHFPNVLLPCSPLMYSALMMASLYGCRCFMCKKNGLKRSLANCDPASRDFSLSKCRRLDHEGNALAPLNDIGSSSHKCAGTQTLFSSFVPPHNFYPQPPPDSSHDMATEEEPRFILDLDHHMARSSQVHPGVVLGGMRRPTSPPLEAETSNAPLNLTLSPSSKSSLRSQPAAGGDARCGGWPGAQDPPYVLPSDQSPGRLPGWTSEGRDQGRPNSTVSEMEKTGRLQVQHKIWTLTHDTTARANGKTTKPQSSSSSSSGSSPRKVTSVVTVECEKDIEEHFQRSLGKDYPKCLAKSKSSNGSSVSTGTEPVPFAPELSSDVPTTTARRNSAAQTVSPIDVVGPEARKGNASVSGAVDDHFAKSLGQTWTKLKSQNSQTDFKLPQPGSVDDHFAKALGDTWFKLRVKKEGT